MIKKSLKFFLNLPLPFFYPYKIFFKFFFFLENFLNKNKQNGKQKNKKKFLFALKNLGLGDCILMRPSLIYFMNYFLEKENVKFYFYHENPSGKAWLDFFFENKIHSVNDWKEVSKKKFFKIYDLSLNENPFVFKLRKINCRQLIGIGFGYKKFLYDSFQTPLQKIHAADYWFYLINGKKNNDLQKRYFFTEKDSCNKPFDSNFSQNKNSKTKLKNKSKDQFKIVMVPFAGVKNNKVVSPEKCWYIHHYLELAEKIYNQFQLKTTFIGAVSEQELFLQKMRQKNINPKIIDNKIGKLNLKQIFTLLQKTKLVICNNSGILHFSVAMKVPTISFSNGVEIAMWKNFVDDKIHSIFSFEEKQKIAKIVFEKLKEF